MSTRKFIVNRGGGWPVDEYALVRYPLGTEVSLKVTPEIDEAVDLGHLIASSEAASSGVVKVLDAADLPQPAEVVHVEENGPQPQTGNATITNTAGTEATSDEVRPKTAPKKHRR